MGTYQTEEDVYWRTFSMYTLALLSLSNNLSAAFQFPYLWYKNGGVAFLIPILSIVTICGLPMYVLEIMLGLNSGSGIMRSFDYISRYIKGIGLSIMILCSLIMIYTNCIISSSLEYIFGSLKSNLSSNMINFYQTGDNYALRLIPLLILVNAAIYIIGHKGARSIGRAIYVIAIVPIIGFVILLVNSMLMPELRMFLLPLLKPDFSKLSNDDAWIDAAFYAFRIVGTGAGGVITYACYAKNDRAKNRNFRWICIAVPFISIFTSVIIALTILTGLGYLASISENTLDQLVDQDGMMIIFGHYSTFVSQTRFAHVHSMIFYVSLFLLGIGNAVGLAETIYLGLKGNYGIATNHEPHIRLLIVFSGFLVSIPCITDLRRHIFIILDSYTIPSLIFLIINIEVCAIIYMVKSSKYSKLWKSMTANVAKSPVTLYISRFILAILVPVLSLTLLIISLFYPDDHIVIDGSGTTTKYRFAGLAITIISGSAIIFVYVYKIIETYLTSRYKLAYDLETQTVYIPFDSCFV